MKTEFSRARRHGYPLACLLLKIDRPAHLDESAALAWRDAARDDLGRLVAEKTREHDHLGFVDDDGYLLVLPHTDSAAAQLVAERVRDAFARLDRPAGRSTLSIGVAACEDRETLFFDTLLSQAELALEWAAEAGGDRAEVFRRDRFVASDDAPKG